MRLRQRRREGEKKIKEKWRLCVSFMSCMPRQSATAKRRKDQHLTGVSCSLRLSFIDAQAKADRKERGKGERVCV